MSDYLQPGQHPDPDSLNAFIEGVLPEHERRQCLAHLAQCPDCREIIFLAQEFPAPDPAPVRPPAHPSPRVPFWQRWLTPIPALTAAMAFGILVLSVWLYQHHRQSNTPQLVAMAPREAESRAAHIAEPGDSLSMQIKQSVISDPGLPPPLSKSVSPPVRRPSIPLPILPPAPEPVAGAAPFAPASAAPTAAPALRDLLPIGAPPVPQRSALLDSVRANASLDSEPVATGIAGTITDPAGAAVAGATVKLRPVTSSASRSLTSDKGGQFNVAGLEPGQYELQVSAPGFNRLTEQVQVQPRQVAHVDSTLSVGSVSDSISVTAESARVHASGSPTVKTDAIEPLPGRTRARIPANTTVAKGKLMLTTDSAGALLLSKDAGKKWTAVKPVWQGKVANLVALPAAASSSSPAFQLTTDAGAVWLSRDGNRWYRTPSGSK